MLQPNKQTTQNDDLKLTIFTPRDEFIKFLCRYIKAFIFTLTNLRDNRITFENNFIYTYHVDLLIISINHYK